MRIEATQYWDCQGVPYSRTLTWEETSDALYGADADGNRRVYRLVAVRFYRLVDVTSWTNEETGEPVSTTEETDEGIPLIEELNAHGDHPWILECALERAVSQQ